MTDRENSRQVKPYRKHGFTLIEVLVVVAIIALLVAILLPSLSAARAQARRVTCMSNLHQIHLALMMYKESNGDRIPEWISLGKWYFRRAPGLKEGNSPLSLQETFGMNALLAGVGPVETGPVAAKKKYLSAYSDTWRCPASPGWMWDQWKNTYANLKLTIDTDATVGNMPTNIYTKLMMRIKRKNGKSWDPAKMPVLQDNYTWKPGQCGRMGTDSWGTSTGYKIEDLQPPHYSPSRKGADGTVILWMNGNCGRSGGKTGL